MSTPAETPRPLIALVDAVDKALKPDAIRAEVAALFGDDTAWVDTWMNEMLTAAILDSVVKRVTPLLAAPPSSEDTPATPITVIAEHHEATGPFTEGWSWSCANRACGTVSNGHASHAEAFNDSRRLAHTCGSGDTPARVWQEGDTIPAHLRSVYGKRTQHFRQADDQNRGADGWWSPRTGVISEQRLLAEHGPVFEVPAGGEPA